MLRNLVILLMLAGAAFALSYDWGAAPAPVQQQETKETSASLPLPEFTFTPFGSDSIRQSESLRGRVVLINFWASWCAPCVVEFPKLIELATRHPERFTLLAISVDHDIEGMREFLDRMKDENEALYQSGALPANVIIVSDPKKALAQDIFQTVRFPESILVSPDLRMIRKIVGADFDWLGEPFASELNKIPGP